MELVAYLRTEVKVYSPNGRPVLLDVATSNKGGDDILVELNLNVLTHYQFEGLLGASSICPFREQEKSVYLFLRELKHVSDIFGMEKSRGISSGKRPIDLSSLMWACFSISSDGFFADRV